MPTYVNNPAKQFQFRLALLGLNPFLAQVVTLPDVEFEEVLHGQDVGDIKTAGKKRISSLMVEKLISSDFLDIEIWAWVESIGNETFGGGQLPIIYKKSCLVEQLSADGITSIKRYQCEGVWPRKINGIELSRTGTSNTIERIEFSVDRMIPF
jgi:tail tube protein gp19